VKSDKRNVETENEFAAELLSGGFFLTRPVRIPKLERIPLDGLLTVSKCLADFVPDNWVYWNSQSAERLERARAMGLDGNNLEALKSWCTVQLREKHSIGYPNVIFDMRTAKELIGLLRTPDSSPLTLLGIGLPLNLGHEICERIKLENGKTGKRSLGIPEMLELGIPEMLAKSETLPRGGESLGFDALSYELRGTFHSSKCFQVDDLSLAGITFNKFGYCDALFDAERLCVIHSRGSGKHMIWCPWAIRRYDP
jgi:hypothetical protein